MAGPYELGLQAAVVPEVWDKEALITLSKQIVVTQKVKIDFQNSVAQFGDTINCRKYLKATVNAWTGHYGANSGSADSDGATTYYADATNLMKIQRPQVYKVPVVLNHYLYTGYILEDQVEATGLPQIREELINPWIIPLGEYVDNLTSDAFFGTDYQAASIEQVLTTGGSSTPKYMTPEDIVNCEYQLNTTLAPSTNRSLVLSTKHHADAEKQLLFTAAAFAGNTETQQTGVLGSKYGFGCSWTQNIDAASNSYGTMSRSLAFHRDAVAFVSRPLAEVRSPGAASAVLNYQGISMRMTVGYNMLLGGTVVLFAVLCGMQLLDADLACYLQDGHA